MSSRHLKDNDTIVVSSPSLSREKRHLLSLSPTITQSPKTTEPHRRSKHSHDVEHGVSSQTNGAQQPCHHPSSAPKISPATTTTTTTGTNNIATSLLTKLEYLTLRGKPLLKGTSPVLSGSLPASESILILGFKPPRYLWYSISGALCDCIQFWLDALLFWGLRLSDPSLCWFMSFTVSVVFRHTSHRYLVFGRYVGGYHKSLIRMYGGYSFSIVASTGINWVLSRVTSIGHYGLWVITMLWTGIVNYFILKKLWTFDGIGRTERGDVILQHRHES